MNKTVLVTGSSRGIGKAIALRFAKEGYNVIVNCVNNENLLNQTRVEVESYDVNCMSFLGDIGDYNTAQKFFEKLKEAGSPFDSIDILINNAGISFIGLLTDMSIEDWERIMRTNVTSVFNCCKFVIPSMVENKEGKIINISSVWGKVGSSCEVAYSASKGAINTMTKALARELAPSNIQVNAIACGAIDTEMNACLDDEAVFNLIEEIPANRLGKAKEVADFVYDLATGHDYLTGQIIKFDGGWF